MLTQQFPKPGDRTQEVEISHPGLPRGTVMVRIPEVDCRQNHISLIEPNNTLLPIALNCLKDRDVERPSAQQLHEGVAALKENDTYAERVTQTVITERAMQELREQHTGEIQRLQESQAREQRSLREEHTREIQGIIAAKEHEIEDILLSRDKANEEEKQRILLEPTLGLQSEGVMQLRRRIDSQKCPDVTNILLAWRNGKPGPQRMSRWCSAAMDQAMVYFNVGDKAVHCYVMRADLWIRLPDCPNSFCSLLLSTTC